MISENFNFPFWKQTTVMQFHICAAGMKRARVEEGAEGLVGPFAVFAYFFPKKSMKAERWISFYTAVLRCDKWGRGAAPFLRTCCWMLIAQAL